MQQLNHLQMEDDNAAAPAAEWEGYAPQLAYGPNQRVWVLQSDNYRPGVVLFASNFSATVRYRPGNDLTTNVNTVVLGDLAVRTQPDPYLDAHGFSCAERYPAGRTRG